MIKPVPVSPPPAQPLTAHGASLPKDHVLYRVHNKRFSPTMFLPHVPGALGGGRFDSSAEDPYPFLYAALSPKAAVAETLLKGSVFTPDDPRLLPWAAVVNRQLTQLRVTTPLHLIDLTTAKSLHAVGATSDLVLSDDLVRARAWASVLRRNNPWADGLLWPSRWSPGDQLVVLFGDRCAPSVLRPESIWPVQARANKLLAHANAMVPVPSVPQVRPFEDFFKAHYLQVCRILNARCNNWEMAQEAASRAFEIAYRNWAEVSEHPNPVAWVVLTGRRIMMRAYQKLAARRVRPLNESDAGVPCDGQDVASATVDKIALHTAMGNLTRDKRECLVMHYMDGYSVSEIAELLHLPSGTVKSRLSAARKDLKDSLGYDFREGGMR